MKKTTYIWYGLAFLGVYLASIVISLLAYFLMVLPLLMSSIAVAIMVACGIGINTLLTKKSRKTRYIWSLVGEALMLALLVSLGRLINMYVFGYETVYECLAIVACLYIIPLRYKELRASYEEWLSSSPENQAKA